jgi:cytochrome c-type biogenesis protein CcmH
VRRVAALLTLIGALLPALLSPTALAAEPGGTSDATLPDIEDEVMCPICGTQLGIAQSPQAERERDFIRERIAEGLDKEEIKDALMAEYGSEVLATPDTSGFDLAAWVVPGLIVIVAGGALIVGVRRWRSRGDGGGDGGSAPPAAGIDPGDEERLTADLGRYEL